MPKQTSGSEGFISVPKGGGAIKGIGETFSPDLFTGTGNFSIPIDLPAGRNGFQPEINLVYSTGSGNGPFGLGWSLSIPGVSRKTAKGVPRYDDRSDIFILSGAEDLVPVQYKLSWTRYRPRTEGLFAKIYHHHSTSENYWEVKTKDGLISNYGTPSAAYAEATSEDPAVSRDPTNKEHIFSWKLTETTDSFGNKIIYEYERDGKTYEAESNDANNANKSDQLYLKRIKYIDYTCGEEGDETINYLVSVDFVYENRPDEFSEFRSGFEIRTRKRCKRIEIHTHAGEDRLSKSYTFVYLDERNDLAVHSVSLPINGVSLLSQVQVTGHDGNEIEKLPPLEFGFSEFNPDRRNLIELTGELPLRSLADPNLELIDLFGNGLPDLVEINGTTRYWRNCGNGKFDSPRQMKSAPAGLALADPGVQLMDANGNGRADLLVSVGNSAGYYPMNFSGEWNQQSYHPFKKAPNFNLERADVRLVDLNGDGVTDAIRSGSKLECYFNTPDKDWNETRFVERKLLKEFPNVNFSDRRVKWADMSGDGLQDIVLVYNGNVQYWPNCGHGSWADRRCMRSSPRLPNGYNPSRIFLGDVDGDGLADLVYVDHDRVLLWINKSGNAWSDPIEIRGTPPVSDATALRLVDLLGTGIAGLLWSDNAPYPGTSFSYFFLDFAGGIKPYLLNQMNNNMGAVTHVDYKPSTFYYLQDQQQRGQRWLTTLPFPVQVVSRVSVYDQFSKGKLTTEYTYHHGYWDGVEREFRGFGRVDQRDSESFTRYNHKRLIQSAAFGTVSQQHFTAPTETRTWFHLGPVGEEFGDWQELDCSHEYWRDSDGTEPYLLDRSRLKTNLKGFPRRLLRDAVRTFRGSILRTELYALDGSSQENRPYTVTEQSYGLCAVFDNGEQGRLVCDYGELPENWISHPARAAVFFPHGSAQRTTQWERGDDPLTQFSFTDDFDDYGQPCQQTQVACPRGWRQLDDIPGSPYLATRVKTAYAVPLDGQTYIHDRIAHTTEYEIINNGQQTLKDLISDQPTCVKGYRAIDSLL